MGETYKGKKLWKKKFTISHNGTKIIVKYQIKRSVVHPFHKTLFILSFDTLVYSILSFHYIRKICFYCPEIIIFIVHSFRFGFFLSIKWFFLPDLSFYSIFFYSQLNTTCGSVVV